MRTALFNYLYAKHTNGTFILRIDDTDTSRNNLDYEKDIFASLAWCGLHHDLCVKQSERKDVYKKYLDHLIQLGTTYELEGATWLKVPEDTEITWVDQVKGKITISGMLSDWVLKRKTGDFTYNFCSVVDDLDLGITTVIRGEDHISNTAKQLDLARNLQTYTASRIIPVYAHLPLLHSTEGAKLSKRAQDLGILSLREMGILPEALVNYLASLGWSLGDKEVYTMAELIQAFDLSSLNRSAARIDIDKLYWFNAQHLKLIATQTLIEKLNLPCISVHPHRQEILSVVRARCRTLRELKEELHFLTTSNLGYDLVNPEQVEVCELLKYLAKLEWQDAAALKAYLKQYAQQHQLHLRQLDQVLRSLLTGKVSGVSITFVLKWMGKEKVAQIFSMHGYNVL
jgi:glutamyl-tRNA synthetase